MNEELFVELMTNLISAINNISKEDSMLKIWMPPITVVLASVAASIITYKGMVKQTNKTHAYSNFLLLSKKKEEVYIYLDIIKKEIIFNFDLVKHYNPQNEPEEAKTIQKSIREYFSLKDSEQKTINRINMVISIYLQELHHLREDLNSLYNEFIKTYEDNYQDIIENQHPPHSKINLCKLKKIKNELITVIDETQKAAININR